MTIYKLIEDIFNKMNTMGNYSVGKWQHRFIQTLFGTVFALRGRVNFTNLARFSTLSEQTFRRNFAKSFDWLRFNKFLIDLVFAGKKEAFIVAIDCTFLPKSGNATYGLDRFWSGAASRAKRGLEASVLAVIHVGNGQSFTAEAAQTPPDLSEEDPAGQSAEPNRMGFYMRQLRRCLARLGDQIRYVVADGYYAKSRVFRTVSDSGRHLITKLRTDANLRYLYEGPQKQGRGAPKRYDGKVCFGDLSHFEKIGQLEDNPQITLYSQTLNSPHFRRNLQVVVLVNTQTDSYVVLACSDPSIAPQKLVEYYRLRFQIELIFRDAKQFAGLTHCQARSRQKLDFHLNMSLAAINLARASITRSELQISMNSFVRQAYNRWLTTRLLLKLGLKAKFGLNHPKIQQVIRMGSIDD